MQLDPQFVIKTLLALLASIIFSYLATPLVKRFAERVGAVDVPRDDRRMHDHPIPRMGGLAIFLAFLVCALVFGDFSKSTRGILIGAVIIVGIGVVDDIHALPAWLKFLVQILAAVVVVLHGVTIDAVASPFNPDQYLIFGGWAIPITILWLVAVTNSVNLIDGLDGLACGVSAIASVALLVIAIFEGEDGESAILLAALTGACMGFLPYNANPAKIFMGDTGALMLGFVLAAVSITGMFKFYTIISFVIPFLAMGLPIADTSFAFLRRLLKGQNPMHADRGHLHHRLIDLGMNQKQAVAVLYVISAVLAFSAVYIATSATYRVLLFVLAFVVAFVVALAVAKRHRKDMAKREADRQAALEAQREAEARESAALFAVNSLFELEGHSAGEGEADASQNQPPEAEQDSPELFAEYLEPPEAPSAWEREKTS